MEANIIPSYTDHYGPVIKDAASLLDKIDINKPESNIIETDTPTMSLLKYQAETQAAAMGKTLSFIKNVIPLQDKPADGNEQALTVQDQKDYLETVCKQQFLATRMLQQREDENQKKLDGTDFDASREPICPIPLNLGTNTNDTVSDTALKLLPTFRGDTEDEAENLKQFLRQVYDVANTNKLTTTCVLNILRRRLAGTATRLIDNYMLEEETPPTLQQVVLKLEDRFMSSWSPEIANAKLSLYTKKPSQTYQSLEGEIQELVNLASRGEEISTRTAWIKSRRVAVFKQAISEDDRQLILRENQSRSKSGLQDMNLSQMTSYLIKIYSEQEAFSTASTLKTARKFDSETVNTVTTNPRNQFRKDKRKQKKTEINNQLKEEVFQQWQQANPKKFNTNTYRNFQKNRSYNNNRSNNKPSNGNYPPRNNNGENKQPPFSNWRKKFNPPMNQSNNQGGGNTGNNNQKNVRPRKFVTAAMVGVGQNCCLKCASPSHRFQEEDKCCYGTSNLMTRPCFNCHEGGHHQSVCIKNQTLNQKPTSGAQEPLDPNFSRWPETTKQIPEHQQVEPTQEVSKNLNWLPSLFPH